MVPVPIRSRIPELLEKIGRDQQWLADASGMSKQQISDYVRMRNLLGIAKAKQISKLLNCHVEDLYHWDVRGE